MDDRTMSASQLFFARLLGREGAAAMEAESRGWLLVCPHCGFERSVWSTGGVRYKASGSGRVGRTCARCGQSGWNSFKKGPDFPASTGPVWPLIRMIVGLVLFIWLLIAAVLATIFWLTGLIR